jgi:hypothetical protein
MTQDIVTRLDAESAISRLLATYFHLLDEGQFSEVAELLGDAEFKVLGSVASGREQIEAFLAGGVQRHSDGTPRTWHSVSNVLIELDPSGNSATSSCYYTVHQQLEGFPLQPIVTGMYLDRFERHAGEWQFSRRTVQANLVGELKRHVGGDATEAA